MNGGFDINEMSDDEDDDHDADSDEMLEAVGAVGFAVSVLHDISGEDTEASSVFIVDGVEMEITVSVRVL